MVEANDILQQMLNDPNNPQTIQVTIITKSNKNRTTLTHSTSATRCMNSIRCTSSAPTSPGDELQVASDRCVFLKPQKMYASVAEGYPPRPTKGQFITSQRIEQLPLETLKLGHQMLHQIHRYPFSGYISNEYKLVVKRLVQSMDKSPDMSGELKAKMCRFLSSPSNQSGVISDVMLDTFNALYSYYTRLTYSQSFVFGVTCPLHVGHHDRLIKYDM